jgi:mRNA interferase RelE/StbE
VYELIIKPSAEKTLDQVPRRFKLRIVVALQKLRTEPRPLGAGKLAGQERIYRIRVGDYRVVYEIEDERLVVLVLRVANRKDAYRGM